MMDALGLTQHYLLQQFGVLPEWVCWDTDFRYDLHLTEADIAGLLAHLSQCLATDFPANTAHNLTDVFDLLLYVVFHTDQSDHLISDDTWTNYSDRFFNPHQFRPFGVALIHQSNLN